MVTGAHLKKIKWELEKKKRAGTLFRKPPPDAVNDVSCSSDSGESGTALGSRGSSQASGHPT